LRINHALKILIGMLSYFGSRSEGVAFSLAPDR
jgi:hypothetical protein